MNSEINYSANWKDRWVFYSLAIIIGLIAVFSGLFPLKKLKSYETKANPKRCDYYISLQSLLASYPLLAQDKANIAHIQHKILQFENDLRRSSASKYYQTAYHQLLRKFNLNSIRSISDKTLILSIANNVYTLMDRYYLDKQIHCINPLYTWNLNTDGRRILRYNLSGLYLDLPNKYTRIISAVSDDWLTGPSPGLFINNQVTTIDTRFMTGMPVLTALYILPKSNFTKVGAYFSESIPTRYFNVASFLDPVTRKVLDVGGVDLFTVTKSDLGKTRIPGTLEFARSVHPVFDIGLKTFVNQQSYGMAYLVNHTTYADPDSIQFYENIIKQHFLKHRDPTKFVAATTVLYQQLMGLKNQHDIILEAKKADQRIENNPAGSVAIKGIVGKRALFHTNCLRDHCTFVFNIAKTPGWHAYVNGKPSEITRANFAFMATTVPHGASTVWFIYESPAQTIPYFFSIISLMVLIILMCSKYMSDPFKYFQAHVNTKDSNDAS